MLLNQSGQFDRVAKPGVETSTSHLLPASPSNAGQSFGYSDRGDGLGATWMHSSMELDTLPMISAGRGRLLPSDSTMLMIAKCCSTAQEPSL
jgi:hypothetical protein